MVWMIILCPPSGFARGFGSVIGVVLQGSTLVSRRLSISATALLMANQPWLRYPAPGPTAGLDGLSLSVPSANVRKTQ